MKAAPAHQIRLLDLQELDTSLTRLEYRARNLPELAELERIDGRLTDLRDAAALAQTQVSDLDREQRKAESDVDQVRTRTDRDQKRLDAGQVSSPKELQGLQSELDTLHRRQAELEEVVLEIMERRETADTERAAATAEADTATAERAEAAERRSDALRELKAEEAGLVEQRARIIGDIPEELAAFYTKLRDQYSGVGAAMLRHGRCEGCKLALSTVELNAQRTADADEVMRCEECRRILVRTPESGL